MCDGGHLQLPSSVADIFQIVDFLDNLATRLRAEHPNVDELSPRNKAIVTVSYLRKENMLGLSSEVAYRDLQNSYIGIALQDPEHPSLPLISVAIFCAVARRLGLDARCCTIPAHVHAMVIPVPGEDMDGRPVRQGGGAADPMYLDPYRSENEVELENLRIMLTDWGLHPAEHLGHATTPESVVRTSRNIIATVQEFRIQATGPVNTGHPTIRLHGNPFADLDNAFYSALWANYMFSHGPNIAPTAQLVTMIFERFEGAYPMDASLIEEHIIPSHSDPSDPDHQQLAQRLRAVRVADPTPKQVRLRDTPAACDGVKFKVGQVFRHRRYGYTAVITGWDMECGMTVDWITHNQVDSLSRGRHQSFYHAL